MPEGLVRGLLVLLVLVLVAPATGQARAAEQDTPGPLRFEADAETTFELGDGRRHLDTIEVRRDPDGAPVLINELSMDDYVTGVAEMPPRWPGEALKAQAVAARTYAWRAIEQGTYARRGLGYDICATVACQVFRGTLVVEESSYGTRWQDAVRATGGEVLLDGDGGPILARYFSTSGGQTLANEVVFPDSGPRAYLEGVEDPDDEVSPYHRWEVELTRDELDALLAEGESLGDAVPVERIERDGAAHDPRASIEVTGRDGTTVSVSAGEFRDLVSRVAPQQHPDRFPGRRGDGLRSLPETMPSPRFAIDLDDDRVVIDGRGWGHGVGMGQYGARGKADRGMTYDDILAAYYNGLRPEAPDEMPDRVRVGLDMDDALTIRADGPFRIVADGEELTARGLGTWRLDADPQRLRLTPPEPWGADLEVGPTEVTNPVTADSSRVVVEAEVNKAVELALEVVDGRGETVHRRDLGVAEPGTHAATWTFDDQDGDRVPAGTFAVSLRGVDEQETRDGTPVEVAVEEPATLGLLSRAPGWAAAALSLLLVGSVALTVMLRRRP